ncbi:hypothetical protein AAVH_16123 [Aphelenchoides avenae]|nr:hypothetical protein AAVH_16123 [Aphelenchus avenae]
MSLRCIRHNDPQARGFVKSSALRGIAGDLSINRRLPAQDYVQQLVEDFRESSSPESLPRVVFIPDNVLCEYASASYHLPNAYVEFFPCPHCTYKDEEERTSFVEVFHFANVHNPNVCATITFIMPANVDRLDEPTECSVEVEFANGYPNSPLAVNHSPRVVLNINTYVFIEVLRCLPRCELEKMLLVSRRWSHVIGGAAASLQQRRCFSMDIKFYGESPGILSVHFSRSVRRGESRILRVLTTRGVSQALNAVRLHLRNAFVESVRPDFLDHVQPPSSPREMLVDISRQGRIDWLKTLLRSMPPNSEIGSWGASDDAIGSGNLLALANCALEPYRQLGCVHALELALLNDDATWERLADLLNQPTIRAFSEITVSTTRVAINTSRLRAILSSWPSLKMHLYVLSGTQSRDSLLKLPTRIIRDFLALEDVNRFVAEMSLHICEPNSVAFSEMPDVDEANGRRKRFRYHLQGEDTVIRVRVYENPTARGCLTVVTFDHFRRTVLFLNGDMSLAELKPILQRLRNFYYFY